MLMPFLRLERRRPRTSWMTGVRPSVSTAYMHPMADTLEISTGSPKPPRALALRTVPVVYVDISEPFTMAINSPLFSMR